MKRETLGSWKSIVKSGSIKLTAYTGMVTIRISKLAACAQKINLGPLLSITAFSHIPQPSLSFRPLLWRRESQDRWPLLLFLFGSLAWEAQQQRTELHWAGLQTGHKKARQPKKHNTQETKVKERRKGGAKKRFEVVGAESTGLRTQTRRPGTGTRAQGGSGQGRQLIWAVKVHCSIASEHQWSYPLGTFLAWNWCLEGPG